MRCNKQGTSYVCHYNILRYDVITTSYYKENHSLIFRFVCFLFCFPSCRLLVSFIVLLTHARICRLFVQLLQWATHRLPFPSFLFQVCSPPAFPWSTCNRLLTRWCPALTLLCTEDQQSTQLHRALLSKLLWWCPGCRCTAITACRKCMR